MVHVLGLGERLAGVGLFGAELSHWGTGDGVEGHLDVVTVSVFLELDVTDFLVGNNSGVVRGDVSGQLGEVGGHMFFGS